MKKIDLHELCAQIDEENCVHTIAVVEGVRVKLARVHGEYPTHVHPHQVELFLVQKGRMVVEVEGESVTLEEGEAVVVPRGARHRSSAADPAYVLVVESGEIRTERPE